MKYSVSLFLLMILISCGQVSRESKRTEISDIEKKIRSEKFSQQLAEEFLKATTDYIVSFPGDTMNPVYLFKQADMYLSVNKPDEAISALKKLEKEYPKHRLTGDALLQQAIIYDNILQKKNEAKILYNAFLKRYPKHPNTAVAIQAIQLIDVDPEDLVRRFEAKKDTAQGTATPASR